MDAPRHQDGTVQVCIPALIGADCGKRRAGGENEVGLHESIAGVKHDETLA